MKEDECKMGGKKKGRIIISNKEEETRVRTMREKREREREKNVRI